MCCCWLTASLSERFWRFKSPLAVREENRLPVTQKSMKHPAWIPALLVAATCCLGAAKPKPGNVNKAFPTAFADALELIGVAVQQDGYHIWGCSPVIGDEGKVHIFCARYPTTKPDGTPLPFNTGWRSASEIAHYVADNPEGPFKFSDIVMQGSGKATWDRRGIHNPTVKKVGDTYAIFYIANAASGYTLGGVNTQRIGLITSKSPYGPWKKCGNDGLVLAPSEDPNHWTYCSRNGVNNPAFLAHPNGKFYLYFKAHMKGSTVKMGVAIADRLEGPYVMHDEPVTENQTIIEDGYVFYWAGKVNLLTTDNQGMIEAGGGILWQSDDGIHFPIASASKGFHRLYAYVTNQFTGKRRTAYYGGKPKFERPQVLMIDGNPAYLYAPSGVNLAGTDGTVSYVLKFNPEKIRATVRAGSRRRRQDVGRR